MVAVVYNKKILIHYFHESLNKPASSWYTSLDITKIKKWSYLVKAFIKQYQPNLELVYDRIIFQRIEKIANEIVKEYVQRWRGIVIQVNFFLSEKEWSSSL